MNPKLKLHKFIGLHIIFTCYNAIVRGQVDANTFKAQKVAELNSPLNKGYVLNFK